MFSITSNQSAGFVEHRDDDRSENIIWKSANDEKPQNEDAERLKNKMGKDEALAKPAIREEREALEEIPMPQQYSFHNVVENNSIPLTRSNSDSGTINKVTKHSGSWQCTLCFHVNGDAAKKFLCHVWNYRW